MGTFAETAIVGNCLSFADQGKQTSVVRPFLFAANRQKIAVPVVVCRKKWKLPFSVSSVPSAEFGKHGERNIDTETWKHGEIDMETWKHGKIKTWRQGHGGIKRKTETHEIFLNPFTVCSSCKRKFVVCPFVD
jgi:hypothetical protein